MSSLTVIWPLLDPPPAVRPDAMTFLGDAGSRIVVPYETPTVKISRAAAWVEDARPGAGRKPALIRGPGVLRSCTFSLTLGYPDSRPVTGLLAALQAAADGGERWSVSYLPLATGLWRISTLDVSADDWDSQGQTTRSVCDFTLVEAGPASGGVGPATGGLAALALQVRPATYTVRAGDSFTSIAIRFYGEARYIWQIARDNNLRNWHLHNGQVLKLPKTAD